MMEMKHTKGALTIAQPVAAEGWTFQTFEDWLASPIERPSSPHGLHIQYAKLAFNAGRAAHPVAGSPVDLRIRHLERERDLARSAAKHEAENSDMWRKRALGGEPMPASEAPAVTFDQAVMLAGIQALCISADQEWCRQEGKLSEFDKGWFTGQLHIFDQYTAVEKSAIAEARAYVEKLSLAAPAGAKP